MRCVITGSDAQGRSFVVREQTINPPRPGTYSRTVLWSGILADTGEFPTGQGNPPGQVELMKPGEHLGVPPGNTTWVMTWDVESTMHWSPTIDFDVVVVGATTLILDSGEVELGVGDCALVPGVRHAWRPGPEGVLLACLFTGVAPRYDGAAWQDFIGNEQAVTGGKL